jgi:large subunit ribosomal protein L15
MKLNELRPAKGSMKKRFKKGRGEGSGLGKTSGRGGKGQTARKSGGIPANFEGGQTPLQRRVPKRGFNSHFAEIEIVNIGALDKRFSGTVTVADMEKAGLISNRGLEVKVLGTGTVTKALHVQAQRFSATAKAAIEAAGGKAEVV